MARLDVFRLLQQDGGGIVVDVQAEVLDFMATRVVVPLSLVGEGVKPVAGLNPVFELDGMPHIFVAQAIATLPAKALQRPVGTLAAYHDDVTRALDILLLGF
jgi:toxin CcdB